MAKTQRKVSTRLNWVANQILEGKSNDEMYPEYAEKFGKSINALYHDKWALKHKKAALKRVKSTTSKGSPSRARKKVSGLKPFKGGILKAKQRVKREYTRNNGEIQQFIDFLHAKGVNVTKHVKEFKAYRRIFSKGG